MKPLRKREKKRVSGFLEHTERPVAVTGTKGKVSEDELWGLPASRCPGDVHKAQREPHAQQQLPAAPGG